MNLGPKSVNNFPTALLFLRIEKALLLLETESTLERVINGSKKPLSSLAFDKVVFIASCSIKEIDKFLNNADLLRYFFKLSSVLNVSLPHLMEANYQVHTR